MAIRIHLILSLQAAFLFPAAASELARTIDAGGGSSASASYQHSCSIGAIGGVSEASSPLNTRNRLGFTGQLFEIESLNLFPQSVALTETSSFRFFAAWLTGDGDTLATAPGELLWFSLGGPVAGISSAGIVFTRSVYQNTAATIAASGRGVVGYSSFMVLNSIPDNHGIYASDGIDDDWQVGFFGEGNPQGIANADPDGDSQNNRFEFSAGLHPRDAASRFSLSISTTPGQSTWKSLEFSPRFDTRDYQILRADSPAGPWQSISPALMFDQGPIRTVIDTAPPSQRAFYRIGIRKP